MAEGLRPQEQCLSLEIMMTLISHLFPSSRKGYSQEAFHCPLTCSLIVSLCHLHLLSTLHLPDAVLGPGDTKMNEAKPLSACPTFVPELKPTHSVSLGTGDRASSDDNRPPLLPHATIQTQEPSELVNPPVNDFGVHKSEAFLPFPGDWGRVGRRC
jgi:hypothetical protein